MTVQADVLWEPWASWRRADFDYVGTRVDRNRVVVGPVIPTRVSAHVFQLQR